MLKLLLQKPQFFNLVFVTIFFVGIFVLVRPTFDFSYPELISILLTYVATLFNYFFTKNSILLKFNYYNTVIILLFVLICSYQLISLPLAIAFVCVSAVNYLFSTESFKTNSLFISISVLLFVANIFFYPTIIISIFFLFVALFSSNSAKAFPYYVVTFMFCLLLTLEILYLSNQFQLVGQYFESIQIVLLKYKLSLVYIIPLAIIVLLGILDNFANSYRQSIIKRNLYNMYILLMIAVIIMGFIFSDNYEEIVIFLTYSVTVFLGKFVVYIKNNFLQNLIILLSILSFIFYYIFDIKFL